ncbi:MAG: glutamate racemase [Clostridia bacterium]|nr:glutamate racemase [Clostridia bacterium]
MAKREDQIVVFDSGVGGISVLRALMQKLPRENFLYFGDSINAPYGTRPTEEIRRLTLERIAALCTANVKAIVIACNTATSAAIEDLRAAYPEKIVIGIEPALKPAADRFPGKTILVMATEATLREEKFSHLMAQCESRCKIVPIPCPELVEAVERNETDAPALEEALRRKLTPHLGKDTAAIVLGCTHFPFARDVIARIAGENVCLIDGSEGTAGQTYRRLEAENLLNLTGEGSVSLQSSLPTPEMLTLMGNLLDR